MNIMRSICSISVLSVAVTGCVNSRDLPKTVADRVEEYGPSARSRLLPLFQKAHVSYPPRKVVFAAFKQERVMEVYAGEEDGALHRIAVYPILGASGILGPKLREGDRQVPEGIYSIEELNPNSRHEIALKVGYPNAFDLAQAAREGRTSPGSDIMIHGGDASIGCLAMGDDVSAELFVLAADVRIENIRVIISPVDFRVGKSAPTGNQPEWVSGLYQEIKAKLEELPKEAL